MSSLISNSNLYYLKLIFALALIIELLLLIIETRMFLKWLHDFKKMCQFSMCQCVNINKKAH